MDRAPNTAATRVRFTVEVATKKKCSRKPQRGPLLADTTAILLRPNSGNAPQGDAQQDFKQTAPPPTVLSRLHLSDVVVLGDL